MYYQYGSALVLKAEESTSLFASGTVQDSSGGPSEEQQKESSPASSSSSSFSSSSSSSASSSSSSSASDAAAAEGSDVPPGDDEVMSTVADTVQTNDAIKEDIEIAWEVLEVARTIFAPLYEQGDEKVRELLARTHLKLGDVQKLNGKFAAAVEDYDQCLRLRESFMAPPARPVADCHYSLAQACEYGTAEVELSEEKQNELRGKSLHHYRACVAVFQAMIDKIKGEESGAGGDDDDDEVIACEGAVAAASGKGKGKAKASTAAPATPAVDGLVSGAAVGAAAGATEASPKSVLSTLSPEMQEEVNDYQEIVEELNETITALEAGGGGVSQTW